MREGKGEKEFKGNGGMKESPSCLARADTHVHTKSTADPTLIPIMLFFCLLPPRLHIYLLIGRVVM